MLELIKWQDAMGVGPNWQETDQIGPERLVITSVGKVISEDEDTVVIVSHIGGPTEASPEQACGDMHIPRASILSREALVPAEAYCNDK